jgi:hypothetical protein
MSKYKALPEEDSGSDKERDNDSIDDPTKTTSKVSPLLNARLQDPSSQENNDMHINHTDTSRHHSLVSDFSSKWYSPSATHP